MFLIMEFNFPDNKTINFGTIQTYVNTMGRTQFDFIDISKPKENLIEINGVSYFFTYLNGANPGNKGGNSILLSLYECDYIDIENLEYGEPDLVLKISKSKRSRNLISLPQRERRFLKEIEALVACNEKKFQNIIKIFDSGFCRIKNFKNDEFDEYACYTMEYAVNGK
jgi:hypothetical protein